MPYGSLDNISRVRIQTVYNQSPMKSLLKITIISLLIAGLTNPSTSSELNLPDLGGQGRSGLTAAEEYRTGASVLRNIRRAGLVVDDPILTDYLNEIGYRLLSHQDHGETKFTFFLVNDKAINAFALPGGFIGINYGLFTQTDTESELASVFAHEIAHVTQRHYARAFDVGPTSSLPILAALIAAIVLGGNNNNVASAALATVAASQASRQINFTRHNEQEADRIGIQVLSDSGFNPERMATFFEKLERESRTYGLNIPEFLRTHPVSISRISDAKGRARHLPKTKDKDSLSYLLMRQRIVALASHDKRSNLTNYEQALKDKQGQELVAIRYGYVLSLLRLQRPNKARQQIDILIKAYPIRIAFLLAQAEVEIEAKKPERAIRIYQHALKLYPNNESILHDYVQLLVKQKQYPLALTTLNVFLKKSPRNPVFYKYLAKTLAALNQPAESHEALAEYYYQIGQFHQAVDQITIALKTSKNNFYSTSRLEAKLKIIQEETPAPAH